MKPYRNFVLSTGAMLALALARAHAGTIGIVPFSNGSTTPSALMTRSLIAQAVASTHAHGHVLLLRAGASPVGNAAYNFVLSGERAAAVRGALVKGGVSKNKIIENYNGVRHDKTSAADRAVVVVATTRQALAQARGEVVVKGPGDKAALAKLQREIDALQEHEAKALHPLAPVFVRKPQSRWTVGVYDVDQTQTDNSTTRYQSESCSFSTGCAPSTFTQSTGNIYNGRDLGLTIRHRPFDVWGHKVRVGGGLLSQAWQLPNQLTGTTTDGSTQFWHARALVAFHPLQNVTVSPGMAMGVMSGNGITGTSTTEYSYSCDHLTGACQYYLSQGALDTYAETGSQFFATPAVRIQYAHLARLTYRQSPWSIGPLAAPKDLTVRVAIPWVGGSVDGGMVIPSCSSALCNQGSTISNGYTFGLTSPVFDGWSAKVLYVGGLLAENSGQIQPFPTFATMAPFNPNRPQDSYNPGTYIYVDGRLNKAVSVEGFYGINHESGGQSIPLFPSYASGTNRTIGLEVKGHF